MENTSPPPITPSWDDIQDKPFGEEQPIQYIEWDGDTTGLFSIDAGLLFGTEESAIFYKITDTCIPFDDISRSTIVTTAEGETYTTTLATDELNNLGWAYIINYGTMRPYEEGGYEDFCRGSIIGVVSENEYQVPTGLYIMQIQSGYNADSHYIEILGESVNKIPDKYIPDTVATVEYVNELISGAIGGSY